jgi:hypothetical protein
MGAKDSSSFYRRAHSVCVLDVMQCATGRLSSRHAEDEVSSVPSSRRYAYVNRLMELAAQQVKFHPGHNSRTSDFSCRKGQSGVKLQLGDVCKGVEMSTWTEDTDEFACYVSNPPNTVQRYICKVDIYCRRGYMRCHVTEQLYHDTSLPK